MADNINITISDEHDDSIKIAEEVIKCIAAYAATDIEGVSGMAGNATNELIARLGGKTLEKGVKLSMSGDEVRLVLSVIVRYGCNIPEVSAKIQDRVRSTIESMTGLTVASIDVNVSDLDTNTEKA